MICFSGAKIVCSTYSRDLFGGRLNVFSPKFCSTWFVTLCPALNVVRIYNNDNYWLEEPDQRPHERTRQQTGFRDPLEPQFQV